MLDAGLGVLRGKLLDSPGAKWLGSTTTDIRYAVRTGMPKKQV